MTTFFNLPSNILSNIYEMDSTYRNIFRDEINYEIWVKSFEKFRDDCIKTSQFDGEPIVARKFDVLLQYLFDNKYVMNGLAPDQITIYVDWHENGDTDNEGLYARIFLSRFFEGNVYTIEQYNIKYGSEINNNYDAIFTDDEFVIVQCNYENYYENDDDLWFD